MNSVSNSLNDAYVLLQRIGVAGKDNVRNLNNVMQILEQIYPALVDMENELAKKEAKDNVQ